MSQLGDLGSGAGKGGGGGGSIREAGGAFGKQEAAREEEYFYKKVSTCLLVLCIWQFKILNFTAKGAIVKAEVWFEGWNQLPWRANQETSRGHSSS